MLSQVSSVSDIIFHVKKTLEQNYQGIAVEGEITNLSSSSSGHWYFTLSDSEAALSCALFKAEALRNPDIKKLKDGDQVLLMGDLNVYPKRGTFQLIVKKLLPAGLGKARLQFELLKNKLMQEGLFDPTRKKKLPQFPKKIILITAPQGAALQDFLNVYYRRAFHYDILIVPALVQGEQAPASLRKAYAHAIKVADAEVIVLLRGGGSQEDLAAFNHEGLVRDIAASAIPTVSAIGHEVDISLTDLVADLRAETPTAAAELLSHSQTMLLQNLMHKKQILKFHLQKSSSEIREKLLTYHPRYLLILIQKKLDREKERFISLPPPQRWTNFLALKDYFFDLEDVFQRLTHKISSLVEKQQSRLGTLEAKLMAFNPQSVLKRGYSLVKSSDKFMGSKKEFIQEAVSEIEIIFHDGMIKVKKEKGAS
jgi:exodeoxyribonuclease VII large subunit